MPIRLCVCPTHDLRHHVLNIRLLTVIMMTANIQPTTSISRKRTRLPTTTFSVTWLLFTLRITPRWVWASRANPIRRNSLVGSSTVPSGTPLQVTLFGLCLFLRLLYLTLYTLSRQQVECRITITFSTGRWRLRWRSRVVNIRSLRLFNNTGSTTERFLHHPLNQYEL